MRIVDIQWHNYRLPLIKSFSTAHGLMAAREGIIVQVITERGISGIGEIAPLPAFGGGSVADAGVLLPALAVLLYGKTLREALELLHIEGKEGAKATSAISAPVRCGLETALLDAIGKVEGCGICTLLSQAGSAPRREVAVNAVIGARATEAAIAAAQEARWQGYRCVKLKVGWGVSAREEIERVAAVRDAIGPAVHLRLDANETWNLEEAVAILTRCVAYDIQYVEQPLKARDLAGMRALRQAVPIPIAVDEALHGLESADLVLDSEAADVLVIKPQLAGGLHVAQQIIQKGTERGVCSVITSAIEAGIGLTAALHLAAASPAMTLECGLASLNLLSDDLLIDDLTVRDGFLEVPTGAGLGVELDWEALVRYGLRSLD
jgi:L-Ala-D/L-Glu epimerase